MSLLDVTVPANPTPSEVERLLNPAYCACVLATLADSYRTIRHGQPLRPLPFPLVFLCLPMVLHGPTRNEINAHGPTYSLHRLVRGRPELLVGLVERVEGLSSITRRSLIFGMSQELLTLDKNQGSISASSQALKLRTVQTILTDEAMRPAKAANLLGAWFQQIAPPEVFLHLGLQPK